MEIDESKIKGIFEPLGVPKQTGLVPNKLLKAPCGATAGGPLVYIMVTKFFFTACSA